MNKKKIVVLIASIVMICTLAVGGTLAYFMDTDAKTNVFTVGNVDITLNENFGDNNPTTPEKLVPATGSAQNGTLENGVKKEVTVTNNGSEKAYVRVHIAIPQILDDGADTFDASANLLHFNYEKNSIGENKWDWSKTTGPAYEGDWNYYEQEIDDIVYNVYVVTYEKVLDQNETTAEKAIYQVYLDSEATNADISRVTTTLGENWKILVVAEGAQEEGFDNAYDALNTAFGVPGTYKVDWSAAVAQ